MNEPAKNPGVQPESYQPQKPEMMRALEEAQGNAVAGQEHSAVPLPEIITKKFMLAGFEAAIDLSESHWQGMDDVIAAMKANIADIGNLVQPVRFVGVWEADPRANYKKKKNHSKRLYFYGLEVTSLDGVPAGCVAKEFPESAFAVFRQRDHGEPAYEWLAAAGYEQDKAFQEKYALDIEIFDNTDNGPPWDFLIPIQAPASYQPQKPEMMRTLEAAQHERIVETIQVNGAVFDVVERPETLWVGTISYAKNNRDDPDFKGCLKRFQKLCPKAPKVDLINPVWDADISFNFIKRSGCAPKGVMYGLETYSAEKQDKRYDLFTQPSGLYMRIRNDEHAAALFGRETCANHMLIDYIARTAAPQNGYQLRSDVDLSVEYHSGNHDGNDEWYVYVAVEKAAEDAK